MKKSLLAIVLIIMTGCATVPKEVVRLSDQIGKDLVALHESYDLLIHEYYSQMREDRLNYLNEEWYPRFIKNWMEEGEVRAIAAGEKVWSLEEGKLVVVTSGTPDMETQKSMGYWAQYALYAYEVKEDSLLTPLNESETALRRDVKNAFQQISRANAVVTAHLNSIREVKEAQDSLLSALDIKELRDSINDRLANISERAAEGLERIRESDVKANDLGSQASKLEM